MSRENLTYQDLAQIISLLKASSQFDEFHLKTGELEVDIKRNASTAPKPPAAPTLVELSPTPLPPANPRKAEQQPEDTRQNSLLTTLDIPANAILIKSPMVGTFYRAPEPGATPFVEIGQQTEESTVVCLIEVMKLINSITAEQRGTITHILVEDGAPVEYGQIIMALAPSA